MDPDETFQLLLTALKEGDREEAAEQAGNLADWVYHGGYLPESLSLYED